MLRLYVAPGGYGKTRLMRELVARRRKDGWDAGFLRESAGERDLEPLLGGRRPLLVVLDYSETLAPRSGS